MFFVKRLQVLRTSQKMAQEQLAELICVAKSVVSGYEFGNRRPSYDVLVRIARVLHTSTDYCRDRTGLA